MLQSDFEEVYDEAAFEVVHVDTDNVTAAALHAHWDTHDPTFLVLTGGSSLYGTYGDNYIPYNAVIDTEGILRYTNSGFEENTLHSIIQQYMSVDFPVFTIQQLAVVGDANGDGRPDPGETVSFDMDLRNSPIAVPATGCTVTLSCADPDVTITEGTVVYPAADPGEVVAGDGLFTFTTAAGMTPHWANFTFSYSAPYEGGVQTGELIHTQRMGRPGLLLVDSDGGADDNENFALTALEAMGRESDVWSGSSGPLSSAELGRYTQLLWLGGKNQSDMTDDEELAIREFVNGGGQLLLSSQYLSANADRLDLLQDMFDVTVADTDGGSIFLMDCAAEDPWFGGTFMVVTGSQAANNNEDPDVLASGGGSTVFATWRQAGSQPAAVYTTGGPKAIFCGFPVEANRVHTSVPGSITVQGFLEHAFQYLEETGVEPLPPVMATDFRLLGATPNPFNPATTVEYRLERAGEVSLALYNLQGQELRVLQAGLRNAGTHQSLVDGGSLASGLYLIRLFVDGQAQDAMKVMLVK